MKGRFSGTTVKVLFYLEIHGMLEPIASQRNGRQQELLPDYTDEETENEREEDDSMDRAEEIQ